jgi:O-antigen/teichoic acid export membrane protein
MSASETGLVERPEQLPGPAPWSVVRFGRPALLARLLRGVVWSTIGSSVGQGASLLTLMVLARTLGKDSYGQFALVQSTAVALATFATLGLGVSATKYVSEYRVSDPAKAGRILGLSSLFAIASGVIFSCALLLAAPQLIHADTLVADLRFTAIATFFGALNGYQAGALAGLEAFRRLARISGINGLTILALSWAMSSRFGIRGAVLAQGAGAFLLWLHCHFALRDESRGSRVRIRYRDAWRERFALFRCSLPAALCGVIGSLAVWRSNVTLATSGSYAELALFTAANTLRLMILFVPNLVTRVTSPVLNNLLASGDTHRFRRTFWGATAANGAVALSLALVFTCAGQWILRLFGKDFVGAATLTGFLLGSVVIEVVAINLYQAIFTSHSLWWQAGILTIWSAVLVGVSRVAVPGHGATGLALAYLSAWSVSALLYGGFAWRQFTGNPQRVLKNVCQPTPTSA